MNIRLQQIAGSSYPQRGTLVKAMGATVGGKWQAYMDDMIGEFNEIVRDIMIAMQSAFAGGAKG